MAGGGKTPPPAQSCGKKGGSSNHKRGGEGGEEKNGEEWRRKGEDGASIAAWATHTGNALVAGGSVCSGRGKWKKNRTGSEVHPGPVHQQGASGGWGRREGKTGPPDPLPHSIAQKRVAQTAVGQARGDVEHSARYTRTGVIHVPALEYTAHTLLPDGALATSPAAIVDRSHDTLRPPWRSPKQLRRDVGQYMIKSSPHSQRGPSCG